MDEHIILHAQGISKSYGDLLVLDDIDLRIAAQSITAIVGKSGSGKSTLLHILGSLDKADSGKILIDNTDITTLKQKKLAKFRNEKLGFIFQFHHLLNEFTALENVCIPAYIRQTPPDQAEKKGKKLLDMLGLSARMTHKPNQLSGGEQQRVAVARSLINDPQIVFADEPTGNLDDHTSEDLFAMIKTLRAELAQTFVLVTHSRDIASQCDQTLTLKDKKLSR